MKVLTIDRPNEKLRVIEWSVRSLLEFKLDTKEHATLLKGGTVERDGDVYISMEDDSEYPLTPI